LQNGMNILCDAAINPQKKKTMTNVASAPVLVGSFELLL
jgi:hypothetical protein